MIYAIDFGSFVKVGMTSSFPERLQSLSIEYKKDPISSWVAGSKDSSLAETIALKTLSSEGHCIGGEKFSCSFEDAVKACMNACARADGQLCAGVINGIKIMVEPATGFIDATLFKSESSMLLSLSQFVNSESVKHINQAIKERSGQPSYFTCKGRGAKTFVHPYIFIEMLRSINAKTKIAVYEWMMGDMKKCQSICDCLERTKTRSYLPAFAKDDATATKIRLACGVKDWNEATQEQLAKRDKIHNNIALLADVLNNNDEAVRIGIAKASGLKLISTAQ